MKIELYKTITPNSKIELPFLSYRIECELYLPTEIVIMKPQVVSPRQVRVFTTNHYYLKDTGEVVDYDELYRRESKVKGFKGTIHYDAVLLVEVWADYGSDGHIEYQFFGWRFIPKSVFDIELSECSKDDYHMSLPRCICCNGDDWYLEERKRLDSGK